MNVSKSKSLQQNEMPVKKSKYPIKHRAHYQQATGISKIRVPVTLREYMPPEFFLTHIATKQKSEAEGNQKKVEITSCYNSGFEVNYNSDIESLSKNIERAQWLEDHMDEFSDFSDWSENSFDEEDEVERLTAIYNTEVLRRVGLSATREELAERGLPWTFLIEPSLPENFENTPWDEERTSNVPPPYAHLDGDPNNPIIIRIINHLKKNDNTNSVVIEEIEQEYECLTIDHWDGSLIQIMMVDFIADQDEMKRDENQIDSQSKTASYHMVHSIEEEHDEIEEKDTPKEEAVEQTSNEACPIQLRSRKQLPAGTTQVEKKSKGKTVEENESTSAQSQQGAKKVVNEKSLTKYDVLAHLKKIQAPLSVFNVLRLS
ncbi:hypothetical protein AAC387_Pa12g0552 [Persea americana]